MRFKLRPYPEYRDSGIAWLGEVPSHWAVRRVKTILRELDRRSSDGDGTLLSLSRTRGLVSRKDMTDKMPSARTLVGYKCYHPGQIVMNRMQAWSGMFGAGKVEGLVSPDYAVFAVLGKEKPEFMLLRVKAPDVVAQCALESKGIGSGFNRLYTDRFGAIPISVPPPEEQSSIVTFLTTMDRRINRLIRAKRRLVELLNEQKQAIIHRAVTRGLDPNVRLKPSGVPWLGEIPEHWETRKLKSLVTTYGGMTPSKAESSFWRGSIPWVSPKDMKVRQLHDSEDHISESALRATGISMIQPPAVLIVVRGMILARKFPVTVTRVPVTVNQDMKALVPKRELNADYFVSLLSGIQADLLLMVEIAGHGTCCLRSDAWGSFALPIPPLQEQQEIERHLKQSLAAQDTGIARTDRQIALMQEYRTRLTADVVTGKLDVRGVDLPKDEEGDVPEGDELPDETPEDSLDPEPEEDA